MRYRNLPIPENLRPQPEPAIVMTNAQLARAYLFCGLCIFGGMLTGLLVVAMSQHR